MSNKKTNGDFIDWNVSTNYVLQWIFESRQARYAYQYWIYRINLAMQGRPSKNLYAEELTSNIKKMPIEKQREFEKNGCNVVPEGQSFILQKAVQNRANQMASGVDSYDYQIDDPFGIIDDDTEDLLAAKCEQDYVNNRLEILSATFSRDLTKYGMAAIMVKYCQKKDKNEVLRIHPKNVWFDTMYSSTGKERFRGYSTMISWNKLKKMVEDDNDEINKTLEVPDRSMFDKNGKIAKAKYANKKIRTLNDLDIYVDDLNKLAGTPGLQGYQEKYWEYDHDLRDCYNLNWYHSFASDPEAKTKSGYNGRDVELTIMYDLDKKIEYKIINRRYIISANKEAFKRKIIYEITNAYDGTTKYRADNFYLDCPLKFQFEEQENRDYFAHPTSPLFPLLDLHDQLCSWRSKRDHVAKILSILRIETNGADAQSLKGVLNIMGIVLDDIQGDINSINFQYDWTPIDSQIAYLEKTIMEKLNAYDQFDALQSMGDRASAAEAGNAVGAVAQGLSTHQNAIMQLYADIARQGIANRVAYSPKEVFSINNRGNNSSVTIQQMALDAIVSVKPKLAKKINEKQIAANAITLSSSFRDYLNEDALAYFIEQAMYGNVSRKMAKAFIRQQGASQQEIAAAQQQAQNQAELLAQNQAAYEQNPIPYETQNIMDNYSPEEIDQIIGKFGNGQPTEEEMTLTDQQMSSGQISPVDLQMQEQAGAMSVNGLEGMTAEQGAALANPNSMV